MGYVLPPEHDPAMDDQPCPDCKGVVYACLKDAVESLECAPDDAKLPQRDKKSVPQATGVENAQAEGSS